MHIPLTPKILIVESQLIIAADISLQFSKLGYDVLGIHSCPVDALPTIQRNPPDIVVMNIGLLRKAAGLKAARSIAETWRIPMVYLSPNIEKEVLKAVIHVQPHAFISKPFDQQDLKKGIETTLRKMASERLYGRKPKTPAKEVPLVLSE